MRLSWTNPRRMIAAAMLCALAGCSTVPTSGIDPSGDRVFAAPAGPPIGDRSNERYFDQPLGQLRWDDVALQVQPPETVASVGSEVVLVAGVCGSDGYLRTNRRLEWSIDPGSVGQFVAVGQTGLADLLVGDFNRPRKVTNTFAIGSTLRANTRLNRGTCQPEDAVYVLRGQGWVSLTSSLEGTSQVTVVAPEVYRWDQRTKVATVHWVDAQWRFPPPAINPAGTKHVFTTSVVRQSNQTPCERWRVKYEIVDGPPAGFSPDGAQSLEVPTDAAGQASVEIFQKEPKHGTNKINIQVIRPGDFPGANGRALIVGSGATMKTWTGADLAVKTTGPATAGLGATLNYRIDVSNPGDLPAKDVVAANTVPDGLSYVGSNPPAEAAGRQLQWRLGEIGARQQRSINVTYRADKQGSISNCSTVTTSGGLKVTDCATTTIGTAALDLAIAGPSQANVGEKVTFQILVKNLSQTPATGLRMRVTLEPGLEHPAVNAQNVIERFPEDIPPGGSKPVSFNPTVRKSGQLCFTVEVIGKGIPAVSKQTCFMAVGAAAAGPASPPSATESPKPGAAAPPLALTVTTSIAPKQLAVGEMARVAIELHNQGSSSLRGLKVVTRYDPALTPDMATAGHVAEGASLVWAIDELPPSNKPTKLEVLCKCEAPAEKAFVRATVATADRGPVESEAYVEIRAAATTPAAGDATPPKMPETTPALQPPVANAGLTMRVFGLHNPVPVDKELTYEICITNTGVASQRQLSLKATAPEGMVLNPLGSIGPANLNLKPTIVGRTITFGPIDELRANESVTFSVRVRTRQVGRFPFHAELTSPTLPAPIEEKDDTEVIKEAAPIPAG